MRRARSLRREAEAARLAAEAARERADLCQAHVEDLREIARASLRLLEALGYEDSPNALIRGKARQARRQLEAQL